MRSALSGKSTENSAIRTRFDDKMLRGMYDPMNNENEQNLYTGADALNDALLAAGVDCVFLNSGTDYPPIIESWAKHEADGRGIPRIIISPHETAALSAAQGYAQITGKAQAVFVHVDVGTQNLGGSIHNAFRCRNPVFILAGLSPATIEGELRGGRNAVIQYLQNAADQAGIVRGYTKLDLEYRSAKNIQQITYRALQIAQSEPMGPVYMTATREVLEDEGVEIDADPNRWGSVSPAGLNRDSVKTLTRALAKAKKPLIITSYSGRNKKCPGELEKLASSLAIPVIEMNASYMNFPGDSPMHSGFNTRGFIEYSDLALVIDCDVPWIPAQTGPKKSCRVFYIDVDPIKEHIPTWYIKAERFMRADSYTALRQLNEEIEQDPGIFDKALIETRRQRVKDIHKRLQDEWVYSSGDVEHISPEFLTMCIQDVIDDDTIILNETISHHAIAERMLTRKKPGTIFTSGGSSLGWHGGAAIGMKLANPDKDVIALTGDGTYIFSCPTAVYWMAAKYNTPFMTVIYNNQGWKAPKMITAAEHPDGFAVTENKFWTSFEPSARLDLVAQAAGGAFAKTVTDPLELPGALAEGREVVRGGTCAVINVMVRD